jgi:hypothetical protein
MRKRLDDAGGDSNVGIEEPRKIDTVSLGDEAQKMTICFTDSVQRGRLYSSTVSSALELRKRRSSRSSSSPCALEEIFEAGGTESLGAWVWRGWTQEKLSRRCA